jgi:hypothetical protein
MCTICILFHRWKFLGATPQTYQLIDWSTSGYNMIEQCIDCGKKRNKDIIICNKEYDECKKYCNK